MDTSATFIGTATVLLRLGGFTVLTDPNFLHRGQRAHLGYGITTKRRTEPALGPEHLPPLDAIVLSHLHGDHFDRIARRRLPHDVPVLTTRPAARRLSQWRFEDAVGLGDWHDAVLRRPGESLRVTAVPARHGPAGLRHALPTTMGSILDWERDGQRRMRLYITGDTLFRPRVLRDIPRRFGDIDVMLLHLGGTSLFGVLVTMDAAQGVQLSELVRPRRIVPIHGDDYTVFRDPPSNFLQLAAARGLGETVRPIVRGETVSLAPSFAEVAT